MDNQSNGGMDRFFDKVADTWKKVKGYFIGIGTDWAEDRKPRAVGKVILPLIPVALLIAVLAFIWKNREAILSGLIVLVTICSVIGYFLDKHAERRRAEAERMELARQAAIRENARTADATYTKMANMVYAVARDLGPVGIVPPRMLSDIYSTGSRMIPVQDGAVMLALFTLQKSGDSVDTDTLSFTMQEKVNKKLAAGEFPGIDRDKTYEGRVYSGFIIHAVVDRPGFVEVYAVLTDENYCRFKAECELSKNIPDPPVDRRDLDY